MSAATTKCWEGIAKCLPLCSLWDRINSVGIKLQFTILIFIQTQRLAHKEAYTHAHATFKSCSQYIQQLILACAAVGRCVLSSQPKGLKTVIRIAFSIIQFHPTFTKSGSTYLKLFLYCMSTCWRPAHQFADWHQTATDYRLGPQANGADRLWRNSSDHQWSHTTP